ncbi:MAG: hypothetical protein R8P61_05030 [Bacteroidia bacterium]|nr:hypothetical protein [Bacteroidia bacterium]
MIGAYLLILSTGILGIFLGAQITEAVLFVPYWKSLDPDDFFELHKTYGKKIHQFFAPLTIAATLIPLATVGYQMIKQDDHLLLWGVMGLATVAFFSTYFLYFKKANQSFADRSLSNEALPRELNKWGNWHWGRIFFEILALLSALALLL